MRAVNFFETLAKGLFWGITFPWTLLKHIVVLREDEMRKETAVAGFGWKSPIWPVIAIVTGMIISTLVTNFTSLTFSYPGLFRLTYALGVVLFLWYQPLEKKPGTWWPGVVYTSIGLLWGLTFVFYLWYRSGVG
jgi:polyferredoxin